MFIGEVTFTHDSIQWLQKFSFGQNKIHIQWWNMCLESSVWCDIIDDKLISPFILDCSLTGPRVA